MPGTASHWLEHSLGHLKRYLLPCQHLSDGGVILDQNGILANCEGEVQIPDLPSAEDHFADPPHGLAPTRSRVSERGSKPALNARIAGVADAGNAAGFYSDVGFDHAQIFG